MIGCSVLHLICPHGHLRGYASLAADGAVQPTGQEDDVASCGACRLRLPCSFISFGCGGVSGSISAIGMAYIVEWLLCLCDTLLIV